MEDINVSQKMKVIMQGYADNKNSKGDLRQSDDEYVKGMIHLLFDGLFFLNDKIQESLIQNDTEKIFFYLGKMALAIDLYKIEIGGRRENE